MFLSGLLVFSFSFLFVECAFETIHNCSVHYYSTCDGGSATLHVPELSKKHTDCDLSLRDENDTILEELTLSPYVEVLCNASVIYLKVHCITPKLVEVLCYKVINEAKEPNPQKQAPRRRHVYVLIPVGLFLLVLVLLLVRSLKKRSLLEINGGEGALTHERTENSCSWPNLITRQPS